MTYHDRGTGSERRRQVALTSRDKARLAHRALCLVEGGLTSKAKVKGAAEAFVDATRAVQEGKVKARKVDGAEVSPLAVALEDVHPEARRADAVVRDMRDPEKRKYIEGLLGKEPEEIRSEWHKQVEAGRKES